MSFYILTENNSVSNVLLDIQENIIAISGEATSAQYFFDEEHWTENWEWFQPYIRYFVCNNRLTVHQLPPPHCHGDNDNVNI